MSRSQENRSLYILSNTYLLRASTLLHQDYLGLKINTPGNTDLGGNARAEKKKLNSITQNEQIFKF